MGNLLPWNVHAWCQICNYPIRMAPVYANPYNRRAWRKVLRWHYFPRWLSGCWRVSSRGAHCMASARVKNTFLWVLAVEKNTAYNHCNAAVALINIPVSKEPSSEWSGFL
jgi:hypothetical protein